MLLYIGRVTQTQCPSDNGTTTHFICPMGHLTALEFMRVRHFTETYELFEVVHHGEYTVCILRTYLLRLLQKRWRRRYYTMALIA